jgi:hypothetical protein
MGHTPCVHSRGDVTGCLPHEHGHIAHNTAPKIHSTHVYSVQCQTLRAWLPHCACPTYARGHVPVTCVQVRTIKKLHLPGAMGLAAAIEAASAASRPLPSALAGLACRLWAVTRSHHHAAAPTTRCHEQPGQQGLQRGLAESIERRDEGACLPAGPHAASAASPGRGWWRVLPQGSATPDAAPHLPATCRRAHRPLQQRLLHAAPSMSQSLVASVTSRAAPLLCPGGSSSSGPGLLRAAHSSAASAGWPPAPSDDPRALQPQEGAGGPQLPHQEPPRDPGLGPAMEVFDRWVRCREGWAGGGGRGSG